MDGFTPWMTLLKVSFRWFGRASSARYLYVDDDGFHVRSARRLRRGERQVPVLSRSFLRRGPGGPLTASSPTVPAGVYGVLLALPSFAALYFYLRILARSERYRVITGKAYRPREFDLGKYRWAASAFVVVYLLLAAVLPICVLVWSSLLPILQLPSLEALGKISLRNYRGLLESIGGLAVIRNTAVVVVTVALLVCFNSFMISWVVVRSRARFRKWVDVLAMLPHAIPGLAFAFALAMIGILASVYFPALPLSGTLAVIVVRSHHQSAAIRYPHHQRCIGAGRTGPRGDAQVSALVSDIMWRIVLSAGQAVTDHLFLDGRCLSFQEVPWRFLSATSQPGAFGGNLGALGRRQRR